MVLWKEDLKCFFLKFEGFWRLLNIPFPRINCQQNGRQFFLLFLIFAPLFTTACYSVFGPLLLEDLGSKCLFLVAQWNTWNTSKCFWAVQWYNEVQRSWDIRFEVKRIISDSSNVNFPRLWYQCLVNFPRLWYQYLSQSIKYTQIGKRAMFCFLLNSG